jgi:hypothetical protein
MISFRLINALRAAALLMALQHAGASHADDRVTIERQFIATEDVARHPSGALHGRAPAEADFAGFEWTLSWRTQALLPLLLESGTELPRALHLPRFLLLDGLDAAGSPAGELRRSTATVVEFRDGSEVMASLHGSTELVDLREISESTEWQSEEHKQRHVDVFVRQSDGERQRWIYLGTIRNFLQLEMTPVPRGVTLPD